MQFLLDAQMPWRLVPKLQAYGFQAKHISSVLSVDAPDIAVARAANSVGSVLMTKDADFIDLSRRGLLQVPWFGYEAAI